MVNEFQSSVKWKILWIVRPKFYKIVTPVYLFIFFNMLPAGSFRTSLVTTDINCSVVLLLAIGARTELGNCSSLPDQM